MKFKSLIISLLSVLLFQACTHKDHEIFWVDGRIIKCQGFVEQNCFRVQENDVLDSQKWEYFYDNIKGFNFEPGIVKKIEVEMTRIDNPPADASSVMYRFVKEIERKEMNNKNGLDGWWTLFTLNDEAIDKMPSPPLLELNLSEQKFLGNDGCNNFSGAIKSLSEREIIFGPMMATRKMCSSMEGVHAFNRAMSAVVSYEIENSHLVLINKDEQKLLRFVKEG